MHENPAVSFAFTGEPEVDKFIAETSAALAELGTSLHVADIFTAVMNEFWRARELHGDQTDRTLGTGKLASYLNDLAHQIGNTPGTQDENFRKLHVQDNEDAADLARSACQEAGDDCTWAHIAGEEFFEMLAEEDPAAFEVEAVQTIAMLLNMILAARKITHLAQQA